MIKKKPIFLFLALALPVLIFIFLRQFGSNQFDVPLPFADGVEDPPPGCNYSYASPYQVPDSIFNVPRMALTVFSFANDNQNIERVLNQVNDRRVVLKTNFSVAESELTILRTCVLLLKPPYDVALVDSARNIRGVYASTNRDEIDRLDTEIAIILKKY